MRETLVTFKALLRRELMFITRQLPSRLIDGFVIVCMQTLAIGKFLPLLGMPERMIGPLYIGTITQIIFSGAYAFSFRHVSDLHRNRYINYQLTLPLPKSLLFLLIILSCMLEISFISVPLIIAGSFFLQPYFSLAQANILQAFCMISMMLFFYAILFIFLAFNQPYTWFIDNVWARRLSPLFLLGCGYYTWYGLLAFNTTIANILLLNPLTYIHEGMRAALLGQNGFLPFYVCFAMVSLFSVVGCLLLGYAVRRRLDPL